MERPCLCFAGDAMSLAWGRSGEKSDGNGCPQGKAWSHHIHPSKGVTKSFTSTRRKVHDSFVSLKMTNKGESVFVWNS